MAANFKPIFTLTPNAGAMNAVVSAANTGRDGSGTVVLIFTAGANGSLVNQVAWTPTGTNVPSVGRMWLNNGAAVGTAGNNSFLGEVSLPANTSTEVAALTQIVWVPAGGYLLVPATYRLYAAVGTVVAAGFAVSCPGAGDY